MAKDWPGKQEIAHNNGLEEVEICFKKQGVASVWKCRRASRKIRGENFQALGIGNIEMDWK